MGYLLAISIGPVQGFIAAARRTRDLWMGSHLLSEISKAAAKVIAEGGGLLIYPALDRGDERLNPSDEEDVFNVANLVLSELPSGILPQDLLQTVYSAAQARFKDYADIARERLANHIDTATWDLQINDVLDFFAAWVPFNQEDKNAWTASRERCLRILAGRKALRDFKPVRGIPGNPKSSLDGARESVLRNLDDMDPVVRGLLWLSSGEQLSAVDLTKRAGSGMTFPSIIRVAVDPWIRAILGGNVDDISRLEEIRALCTDRGFAQVVSGRYYQEFPFDGQILFPSRLDYFRSNSNRQDENDLSALKKISPILSSLVEDWGEPYAHLSVLVADGDHMGELISTLGTIEAHREFSRQLASFAGIAREIVLEHHGVLVYSGGDDILAFIPADECLQVARELRRIFFELLEPFGDSLGHTPTLSTGIAIGHFLEPLEDLLNYGRNAETAAKEPDRNGLAIHFYPRGGNPIFLRRQWTAGLDRAIERWIELQNDNLVSNRFVRDLMSLRDHYLLWKDDAAGDLKDALVFEVENILNKKKPGGRRIPEEIRQEIIDRLQSEMTIRSPSVRHPVDVLDLFVREFLIARALRKVFRRHYALGVID